jgi:hypothetical protein
MTTTDLHDVNTERTRLHRFEAELLPALVAAGFHRDSMYAAWAFGRRAGQLLKDSKAVEATDPEQARALGSIAAQCWLLCSGLVQGAITAEGYTGPLTDEGRLRLDAYPLHMRRSQAESFESIFGAHSLVRVPEPA